MEQNGVLNRMEYMEPKNDRIHTMAGHSMYPSLSLRALSDVELLARLDALVSHERETTADVIEHLSELDRREVALDLAYASLYEYCVKKLGYTEGAAYHRIRTARAALAYPEIVDRIREGRLHLEAVVRLYPHLTDENHSSLFDRVEGATKREVVAFVATLEPEPPPTRDVISPIPAPQIDRSADTAPSTECVPVHHRIHFTADEELIGMVAQLKGLLRHKYPDGRLESIFKEAAKTLIAALDRQRSPSKRRLPTHTGTVPRDKRLGGRLVPKRIKRDVWSRDQGRCSFRAEDGALCGSREALEYDHIVAWADGGRSDAPENIRLLCRAHNQRLGRRRFGPRRGA